MSHATQYYNDLQTQREKYGKAIAEYFTGGGGETFTADNLYPLIVYRALGEKTEKEEEAENTTPANAYIRWDAFCHLLNSHVIPKNPKDSKPLFTMSCVQLINEDLEINKSNIRAGKHVTPMLMAKVDNPLEGIVNTQLGDKILDSSLDPTMCLLPRQLTKALNHSFAKQLQPFIVSTGYVEARGDQKVGDNFNTMCGYDLTEDERTYNIGHILLNVKRLQQMYKSMKYDADGVQKKDFYLYDYVKKIWDNVNDACAGNHDFKLTTDFERPNIVRVVDMRYQESANLKQEDIIDLNIQSTDSIVRDFAYNTSIPSAMSATIAIAAQSPRDINNIEGASFGAFHQNISNRFARFTMPSEGEQISQEEIDLLEASFDDELKTYVTGISDLATHIKLIGEGKYLILGDGGDAVESEEIGKHKGLLNAVKRASKSLIKRYPTTTAGHYKGQFIPRVVQEPTSAIIPLKFNATLDGIGGIVIGNVFKIPASRLPRGYKDSNIAFVVMGEDQNITSGQDWTTKVIGQMIILDDKSKNAGQNQSEWDAYDYNQYDESANTETQYVDDQPGSNEISEEQKKIDEGLSAVREGDKVYLKLNNEYTHVRTGANINHESRGDWRDNVIGAFPKGNAGLELGVVREIVNTSIYVQAQNGKFYRANADGTPNTSKPIDPSNIPNDNWPWYKIKFGAKAIAKFKPGWIVEEDGALKKNGADKKNTPSWVDYKLGWMRIDVILSETGAKATVERINNEEEVQKLEQQKLVQINFTANVEFATRERVENLAKYLDLFANSPNVDADDKEIAALTATNIRSDLSGAQEGEFAGKNFFKIETSNIRLSIVFYEAFNSDILTERLAFLQSLPTPSQTSSDILFVEV